MLNRLSQKRVESLRKVKGRYADGGNLYLEVSKPPFGSWILRYQLAGQPERSMGLGSVDVFSLAEIRERVRPLRQLLADGICPLADRRAKKAEATKTISFEEAATRWFRQNESRWRKVGPARWKAMQNWVFPILGNMLVSAVDTAAILRVLEQPLPLEGGTFWTRRTTLASRLRGFIENILDWAKVRG